MLISLSLDLVYFGIVTIYWRMGGIVTKRSDYGIIAEITGQETA